MCKNWIDLIIIWDFIPYGVDLWTSDDSQSTGAIAKWIGFCQTITLLVDVG